MVGDFRLFFVLDFSVMICAAARVCRPRIERIRQVNREGAKDAKGGREGRPWLRAWNGGGGAAFIRGQD